MNFSCSNPIRHATASSWLGAAAFTAWLGCAAAHADSSVECCNSLVPQFPPATAYGATMYRGDDPRSNYQVYSPMPIDTTATAEKLSRQVSEQELRLGPYSPELVPDLRGLGAALYADEQFFDAISAFARAIHLLRINEGLNTLSQTELVEQMIEAQIATGNYIAADDQHKYLFRIQRANLDVSDPQMLAAVQRYADWLRAAYLGELDRDRYPRIVQLLDLYSDVADEIAGAEGEFSPTILPYLRGKLSAQYLLSTYSGETEEGLQVQLAQRNDVELPDVTRLRFIRYRDANYKYGLKTILRMRSILENSPESTPRELANVQVALGDWYQWHRRYAQAMRTYGEAWEIMALQPDGIKWSDSTFAQPLELPSQIVFQPGRVQLKKNNAAEVKARFAVSPHGEAKEIDILAPLPKENQPAVVRAYKYLRDMRFRPKVVEGEVVVAENLERTYSIRY